MGFPAASLGLAYAEENYSDSFFKDLYNPYAATAAPTPIDKTGDKAAVIFATCATDNCTTSSSDILLLEGKTPIPFACSSTAFSSTHLNKVLRGISKKAATINNWSKEIGNSPLSILDHVETFKPSCSAISDCLIVRPSLVRKELITEPRTPWKVTPKAGEAVVLIGIGEA
jgi:hypothetical protein